MFQKEFLSTVHPSVVAPSCSPVTSLPCADRGILRWCDEPIHHVILLIGCRVEGQSTTAASLPGGVAFGGTQVNTRIHESESSSG